MPINEMLFEERVNEEQQKKKPSCLGVIVKLGAFLGVLLAVITALQNLVGLLLQLPNHFVIQISSFQISIGATVIIALIILFLMGLSFTLGMFYLMFGVVAIITKKKTPLYLRPFEALSFPFLRLANWITEKRYNAHREKRPSTELQKRILASFQKQKDKKSG